LYSDGAGGSLDAAPGFVPGGVATVGSAGGAAFGAFGSAGAPTLGSGGRGVGGVDGAVGALGTVPPASVETTWVVVVRLRGGWL
jgi:hypothetical protein